MKGNLIDSILYRYFALLGKAGVEVGVAADAGYNSHDKNVALKATTPVGAYGLKVGCKNEVCFVGCFSLSIC